MRRLRAPRPKHTKAINRMRCQIKKLTRPHFEIHFKPVSKVSYTTADLGDIHSQNKRFAPRRLSAVHQ